MKLTVTAGKKSPLEGQAFTSQGFACEIEVEPPQEVQQDREALKRYIERLFDECRARVEDQLAVPREKPPERRDARRNGQSRRPHRPMPGTNGRGNGNDQRRGENGRSNGEYASGKQLAFLKRLAQDRGIGYGGLQELARDEFGTADVLRLTRHQASRLIDELRPEDRR